MSELAPDSGIERIKDALIEFTAAIGNAVEDICSYGLTIGESYVPFDPDPEDDCEDDEVACSQLWTRVMSVAPLDAGDESWAGNGCALSLSIDIEVGIFRCIAIPEDGEAPTATDVLMAAMQAIEDMNTIQCVAMSTEVWESISIGQWQPTGPLGGQYGGIWTFTVEI